MLEQYRAVAESEEYKASPAYRLQEYLKQFQRESGYNDVFISAMQRLSPAYREYHKSLQARRRKSAAFIEKLHICMETGIEEFALCMV